MWAMAVLSWSPRLTLYVGIIIAAGTLAAFKSSTLHHCATSPNGGSEETRGLNLIHNTIDSDVDSAYLPINRGGSFPQAETLKAYSPFLSSIFR